MGVGQRAAHQLKLFFDQKTAHRGQVIRDSGGGSVRPVRGAEGVVDVKLGQIGQLAGKRGIVFCLFRVEAHVFQKRDLAVLQRGGHSFGVLAHNVGAQADRPAHKLRKTPGNRRHRILRFKTALGPPQMGAQNHAGPAADQIADRGQALGDTPVVLYNPILDRHIEITADQHPLAGNLHILHSLFA